MNVAAGIGVANFGDRAIILDCRANRYHQVGTRHAAVLAAVGAGLEINDREALDTLIHFGIVDPLALRLPAVQIADVRESALDTVAGPPANLSIGRVAVALLGVVTRLRWTSFPSVLAHIRSLKTSPSVLIPDPDLIALARAYDQVRPRIPIRRICLRDSLALFAILARAGGACNLVFGVRLDPFGAHCWVQTGETILSDSLESARHMRPILVL